MHKIMLLYLLFLYSPFVMSKSINIHVYGKIIASPCEVETKNYIIDLNKISVRNINNNKSDWVSFSIKLKNCPITTQQATIILKGVVDPNNQEYFINNGTAKGVALNLAQEGNKNIIKNNDKLIVPINEKTHGADFPLSARMIGYENNVTLGTFKSHLEFTLFYH